MRTGASDVPSRGLRGQVRPDARLKKTRKTRLRRAILESDFLEPRTLLATIPAAVATAPPIALTGFQTTTDNGNANSPTVVIDPYDSQKLFAVWGHDLSTLNPVPHTTAVIEGAYSDDGGKNWSGLGQSVSSVILDAPTINATPPTELCSGDQSERRLRRPAQRLYPGHAVQRCHRWRTDADQVQFLRHDPAIHLRTRSLPVGRCL